VNAPWDDRGDRRLLRRMADGDREALAELYDRHAAALFAHAVALTRSPADAEDLVQGVFVKVAGMEPACSAFAAPARTCMGCCERRSLMENASQRSGRRVLGDSDVAAGSGAAEVDRLALEAALSRLPVEQREVVVLHAVQGLTFREVAAMTNASIWTIASRYRLGLDRLRGVLGAQR